MPFPVAAFAGAAHTSLTSVRAALTEYRLAMPAPPVDLDHLRHRLAR